MMGDTHKKYCLVANGEKKGKYIEACLERRFHFTTLVLYMDRVMVEYKKVATKQLAAALATK